MKDFFENLSPKATFFGGLAAGVLVLCTVGFFILLGVMFSGKSKDGDNYKNTAPSKQAVDDGTAPSGAISLAPVTDKDWYKGGKDAKVTIVEFSDTECPFCKRFHNTMHQVLSTYGDKVKWVYRHSPLDSLHPKARHEAEAAECAGEQGGNDGFWKFLDKVYEVTPSNNGLDAAQLPVIAEQVGLNRAKFESCLTSGRYAQKIQDQSNDALKAGMQGTPYSVILKGDQKIPISGAQPFEQVKAQIDSLL